MDGNFTYTEVEEDLGLRIPKVKVNAGLTYNWRTTTFRINYNCTDKREDLYFNPETFEAERETLPAYSLFNLYFNHSIIYNHLNILANVYNVFNTDYTELFGYSTKGRNFNLGIDITL